MQVSIFENKVFLIINLIHNATSYVHRCRTFPNCKYGNNCLYIHPKCKYDSSCTRYDCTYLHTSPRILPPGMCSFYFDDLLKSSLVLFEILDVIILFVAPARPHVAAAGMNQPCKYYYNCTNPVCPYLHPKVRFRANSLYLFIYFFKFTPLRSDLTFENIFFSQLCRYDRYCTNKNCTFSHTSLIHVGGQGGGPSSQYNFSKLKWCRPKDANNENKNGSNDAKTEIDAAVEN